MWHEGILQEQGRDGGVVRLEFIVHGVPESDMSVVTIERKAAAMGVDDNIFGRLVITKPKSLHSRFQLEGLRREVVLLRPLFIDLTKRLTDVPMKG